MRNAREGRAPRRPTPLPALLALLLLTLAAGAFAARAQTVIERGNGPHTLFGDIKAEGVEQAPGAKAVTFEVALYTMSGGVIGRQTVPNHGRYRFMDLHNGHYDVSVSVESREVARVRVLVDSLYKTDFRQDISLETDPAAPRPGRAQTVSAADLYVRAAPNQSVFQKAQAAMDSKKYAEAATLLGQLTTSDAKDFHAWTELGTAHLLLNKTDEAEKAYRRALEERPGFPLALLNLGRLLMSQKKYEAAVEPLTRAAEAQPPSAEANFLLGEAYLQLKKGSKAVTYLNEALRLDPDGKADAHLRLGALYNAAGLKDRAALEYEQFLKKRPDHPEKKKLQQYVAENKKQ